MHILTEDEVIDAVIELLRSEGWDIALRAHANERGDDLVAIKGDKRLIIEAKGAGSSKPGTHRYGREFDRPQVFDHVAKAVLKALRVVENGQATAAIAFPDNESHRREVDQVRRTLTQIGITVFWVSAARRAMRESAQVSGRPTD